MPIRSASSTGGSRKPSPPRFPSPTPWRWRPRRPDGRPSLRIVLLRGYDERGFTFFTNYESRKGRELEANPHAALVFYWHDLERQVRIEGRVERVSPEESDAYFHSRPAGSRLGAWASRQSEVIPSREVLEAECLRAGAPIPERSDPPARVLGRLSASSPNRSNSGRAGPAGCTTGCGTAGRPGAGGSNGSRLDCCIRTTPCAEHRLTRPAWSQPRAGPGHGRMREFLSDSSNSTEED